MFVSVEGLIVVYSIIKVTNVKIVYCLENNCLVNLVCLQGKMLWHMK
jgi:hypothetical protein